MVPFSPYILFLSLFFSVTLSVNHFDISLSTINASILFCSLAHGWSFECN